MSRVDGRACGSARPVSRAVYETATTREDEHAGGGHYRPFVGGLYCKGGPSGVTAGHAACAGMRGAARGAWPFG